MRSKEPSRADQQLLQELRRRKCEVSFPKIERWRYWRKTGLVPRTVQHGLGRGSTSEHADLDESVARICEVVQLRKQYRSLDEIALVLTMRHRPLDPTSVKQALLAVIAAQHRSFLGDSDPDDPIAVAHNAVLALKHQGSHAAKASGFRTGEAAMTAAQVLAGADVQQAQVEEFVEGTPISSIASELGYATSDVTAVIAPAMPFANYASLLSTIEAAAPQAVVEAIHTANDLVARYMPPRVLATATGRDFAIVGVAVSLLLLATHADT